jgi:hypothetical protein
MTCRVSLHQAASRLPDGMLPFCTPDEQWRRPDKWAVMKPGRKSAVRLCDSKEEADAFIGEKEGERTPYTELQPAQPLRCRMYCDVAPFCNQCALEMGAEALEAVND